MLSSEHKKTYFDRTGITIILLATIYILIHLLSSNNLEYHRDELLYFSLGLHPGFGYATVPPLTGWLAWLIQNVIGYSVFAVRLLPAIAGGVTVIIVSELARELGGSDYSRILAAVGMIISVYALRTFFLFQPVFIDLVFWTVIFYLIVRYKNTASDKYLIYIGITAGIALLNKYLIGLLIAVLAVTVLFTSDRKIFLKRSFWVGILAGTLIFLPNLIWQIMNHFPVIEHLSELNRTQLVNVRRGEFLTEQLIMPGFASFLTVSGLIFLFTGKSTRRYRFLGMTLLLIIVILLILKAKNYYSIGIFPFLCSAGAVSYERIISKRWLRALFPLVLVLLTIPGIPIGIPVFRTEGLVKYFKQLENVYGLGFVTRFEDGSRHSLPQDYADMLGWEELASLTAETWDMIPDKSSAFIFCENYGQAGAVTIIGRKYGLPHALSFSESFRYWNPVEFENEIKTIIYINGYLGEDVKNIFGKITLAGSISNPHAREYGTSVFLCGEPLVSFNNFWSERIKQIR